MAGGEHAWQGGMHPTGMYSCLKLLLSFQDKTPLKCVIKLKVDLYHSCTVLPMIQISVF